MTLIGKRACVLSLLVLALNHCAKPTRAAPECDPACADAGAHEQSPCCGDPIRVIRVDGGDLQFGAHEPTQCLIPPDLADGSVFEKLADGGEAFCPEREL
jgi:hypothetical protein